MNGTEKQIKWAQNIIAEAMNMNEKAIFAEMNGALANLRASDAAAFGRAVAVLRAYTTVEALAGAFREWLKGIDDAHSVIENRGMMVAAFVAAIAR